MKKITIAIDGHSSCGKSTMAKDLARKVGYIYVDTGAMYRSVTLYALRNGLFNDDDSIKTDELEQQMDNIHITFQLNEETGRPDTYLNGECVEQEIRSLEVSNHVSPIAALGFVREAMVAQQQLMGQGGGVVMDGRDIGTVVLPNAPVKIYLTATPEARAMRRLKQLQEKGDTADFAEVLAEVNARDEQDMNRAVDPLRQAEDAIVVDSSDRTFEETVQAILRLTEAANA